MGVSDQMKRVAQEIVSSYHSRISAVAAMVDDTYRILEEFRTKRNKMSDALKETLAKGESLRKKDYDRMMENILFYQDEREKKVKSLLKTFFEEQKEVAEIIRKNLEGEDKNRIGNFKKMLEDIQARQRSREEEVRMVLGNFQEEYREIAGSLHTLLNKGETIQISDFKEMVKNIRTRQIDKANEVKARLNEFSKARKSMVSKRQNKVTNVMGIKEKQIA